MTKDVRDALSHVLWIGGATDSGKSTVAEKLAERHGLQVYHYDRRDLAHHEQLAKTNPAYQALWLVPSEAFKQASIARRVKPSFGAQVSDPEWAKANLLERDRHLAVYARDQVLKYAYTMYV